MALSGGFFPAFPGFFFPGFPGPVRRAPGGFFPRISCSRPLLPRLILRGPAGRKMREKTPRNHKKNAVSGGFFPPDLVPSWIAFCGSGAFLHDCAHG